MKIKCFLNLAFRRWFFAHQWSGTFRVVAKYRIIVTLHQRYPSSVNFDIIIPQDTFSKHLLRSLADSDPFPCKNLRAWRKEPLTHTWSLQSNLHLSFQFESLNSQPDLQRLHGAFMNPTRNNYDKLQSFSRALCQISKVSHGGRLRLSSSHSSSPLRLPHQ